jgi:hypothetical protein
MGVGSFDVSLEMLVREIGLVTAFVAANIWSLVGM